MIKRLLKSPLFVVIRNIPSIIFLTPVFHGILCAMCYSIDIQYPSIPDPGMTGDSAVILYIACAVVCAIFDVMRWAFKDVKVTVSI